MSEEEIFEKGIPKPPEEDFPLDEEEKPKKKKKKSIEDELFGDEEEEEEEKPKKKKDEFDELFEQNLGSGEDIYANEDFERFDDGVGD